MWLLNHTSTSVLICRKTCAATGYVVDRQCNRLAIMATVTDKLKETLMGEEEDEPNLSATSRAEWMAHARKDEQTGEIYMGEQEFVNAIAPQSEDYVSIYESHWED